MKNIDIHKLSYSEILKLESIINQMNLLWLRIEDEHTTKILDDLFKLDARLRKRASKIIKKAHYRFIRNRKPII